MKREHGKDGKFVRYLSTRECSICRVSFQPRLNNIKVCSRKCMGRLFSYTYNKQVELVCQNCGKQFKAKTYQKDTAHYCSVYCRSRTMLGKIGVLSSNWRGGRTSLQQIIRSSFSYFQWRTRVFKRDNYTCQMPECNQYGRSLEANHIYPFHFILQENNIHSWEDAIQCEKLWDISNGITLCQKCHYFIKGEEKKWMWVFNKVLATTWQLPLQDLRMN